MEKSNLSSVKKESIRAIFNAVSSKEQITRSEIAAKTGLSLMTVGKVVDALIEREIFCQAKEIRPSSGRRAGLISLSAPNFFLIIDLSSHNFVLSAIDIGFRVIDRMMYEYNSDFYFEENLYIFLKNVNIYLRRRFDRNLCSGVGVSLPGAYNSADDRVNSARLPEINTVNIRESIHSVLNLPICLLEQDIKLAATSNITLVPDYQKKVISYLYIGESIDAATISQGQLLYGANFLAGQICALPMGSGTTVGKIIEESQNQEDIADVLVYIIRVLCCVIDPHEIIIECDRYKLSNGYLDMLTEQLSGHACFTNRSMPKISLNQGSIKHAHRGLVMKLRDMWVDSLN